MEKLPPPEPSVAKTVRLPVSMWEEIDALRRTLPGKLPSEPMTVRLLVRRALDAFARPRWQPIETMPRDGRLMIGGRGWVDVWHAPADGYLPPGTTHWRPLPEPPGGR